MSLLNPYDSSGSSLATTPMKDSTISVSLTNASWIVGVTVTGALLTGVLILIQWFALDWVSVRVLRYPEDLGTYDWAFIASPILPLLMLFFFRWISPKLWTLKRIVAMTIFGWIVAVVLIATVGIEYHFWIGGTL